MLDDAELRLFTSQRLVEFTNSSDCFNYTLLRQVLGKLPFDYMFTEEDRNTCEALLGPNGYTVFRMICIRRNINTSIKTGTTG